MAGYGSRVRWNDGEPTTSADLENMGELRHRAIVDEFVAFMASAPQWGQERTYRDELRPYRNALMPLVASTGAGFDVAIHAGPVMAVIGGASVPDENALKATNLLGYYPGGAVTVAAADPSQQRRDLIQARIVEIDEPDETRHFEDAATRIKSSITVLKRTNTVVEVAIKTGTSLQAGNTTPADEPAPDAGWFKVASLQVNANATTLDQRRVYDYRMPMGAGSTLVKPNGMIPHDQSQWEIGTSMRQAVANRVLRIPLMDGARQMGELGGSRIDQRRIMRINLHYRFGDAPNQVELGSEGRRSSSVLAEIRDVSAGIIVASGDNDTDLYVDSEAGYGSPAAGVVPLWANGMSSPAATPGDQYPQGADEQVVLEITGGLMTGFDTEVHSVATDYWGGL